MSNRTKKRLIIIAVSILLLIGVVFIQLPAIGAALILHPVKRPVTQSPPNCCHEVTYQGDGITLKGWCGQTSQKRRGTIIYLHGISDNRESGTGVIKRFVDRGFDVIAYDNRAHGESAGDFSTYGYLEKEDLRRIINTLDPGPVVLIGSSLGGAVALQTAAYNSRVTAVVAAETFSDLRTVVTERAPFLFTANTVNQSIAIAEQKGNFSIHEVSPIIAAKNITIPVFLIHGESDVETPKEHTYRIYEALAGPKKLVLVPNAGHNESLQGNVWEEIEQWIDTVVSPKPI